MENWKQTHVKIGPSIKNTEELFLLIFTKKSTDTVCNRCFKSFALWEKEPRGLDAYCLDVKCSPLR